MKFKNFMRTRPQTMHLSVSPPVGGQLRGQPDHKTHSYESVDQSVGSISCVFARFTQPNEDSLRNPLS